MLNSALDLPKAWLGHDSKFLPELVIRICMDCPDMQEATDLARAMNCESTHGFCAECFARRMIELESFAP